METNSLENKIDKNNLMERYFTENYDFFYEFMTYTCLTSPEICSAAKKKFVSRKISVSCLFNDILSSLTKSKIIYKYYFFFFYYVPG